MAVQEILLPDGADFAVAEKTGEAERAKMILHQPGIMARAAKKVFAPPGTTKQAAAINLAVAKIRAGRLQQVVHVL